MRIVQIYINAIIIIIWWITCIRVPSFELAWTKTTRHNWRLVKLCMHKSAHWDCIDCIVWTRQNIWICQNSAMNYESHCRTYHIFTARESGSLRLAHYRTVLHRTIVNGQVKAKWIWITQGLLDHSHKVWHFYKKATCSV